MKLQARQIEAFISKPFDNICAVLIYGPDHGLIRERSKKLAYNVVPDVNDPFNVSMINCEELSGNYGKILEEAYSVSLMGGKRLLTIKEGTDILSATLKEYLKSPNNDAFIIIESGELGTKSSLRKLFEADKNAVALPCYVEEERALIPFIRNQLSAEGYSADHDTLNWLAANLKGDRLQVVSEVDKLITYMGKEKKVTLNDAMECCGKAGATSIDELVYGTASKRAEAAIKAYNTLIEEGTSYVIVMRSLLAHFKKVHLVKSYMRNGMNETEATAKLYPPVFFKYKADFSRQVQSWSMNQIEEIMNSISESEALCKKTGIPAEALCGQLILDICNNR